MKKAKRIYCIEGHHDWGNQWIEPSVEPMLQLLVSTGYWEDYIYRKCITVDECRFYLEEEWSKRCDAGSILYFSSHGGPGEIWLSGAPGDSWCEVLTLDTISAWETDCSNCLIHFGCCSVFAEQGEEKVKELIQATQASYVSGYKIDVNWLDAEAPPALALEMLFFGSISELNIDLSHGRYTQKMRKLATDLDEMFTTERFGTCEFSLQDWWD